MVAFTEEEVLGAVAKFPSLSILVVGDIILDRYIWGSVDRVSAEAPVPVVEVKRTEDRLGGAGNVVRNLRRLGAQVLVSGFVGDDAEGKLILELLGAEGVGTHGILIEQGRPTTLKSRVVANSQQVVRIDREVRGLRDPALREGLAAIVEAQIDRCDCIIVSDYGKGAISDEVLLRLQRAASQGRAGPTKRAIVLDPHPQNFHLYAGKSITLAKPNRAEAERATGIPIRDRDSAEAAAWALTRQWHIDVAMVTLGEDGLVVADVAVGKATFLPTEAIGVFDVSGAGDTVTAVAACSIAAGASPTLAGYLANVAAGIVVGEVGTAPIEMSRLQGELRSLYVL